MRALGSASVLAVNLALSLLGCGGKSDRAADAGPQLPVGETGGAAGSGANQGGRAAEGGSSSGGSGAAATAGTAQGGETAGGTAGGSAGAPDGGSEMPRPYRAKGIVTGSRWTCSLLEDDRVKCWGVNGYGQLGLGDTESRGDFPEQMGDNLPFVDLGAGRRARMLAAGGYSTCAVLDDESLRCWGLGAGAFGGKTPIGDAPNEMGDALPRVELGAGRTVTHVAIGVFRSCASLDDGSFFCRENHEAQSVPALAGARATGLFDTNGVLGLFDDGTVRHIAADLPVVGSSVQDVAANRYDVCSWHTDGVIRCGEAPPTRATVQGLRSLDIDEHNALCVVRSAGEIDCWGGDEGLDWPAGDGGARRVPLGEPARAVSAGLSHHCALLESGSVVCWYLWKSPYAAPELGVPSPNTSTLRRVDLGTYQPP